MTWGEDRRTGDEVFDMALVGKARDTKLDELEAQYFWAVATEAQLCGHLSAARLDRIRYANACQDLSRPLPPWQLQTLCGLAAGQLAQLIESEGTSFKVWRLTAATGAVQALALPVQSVSRFETGQMRVTITAAAVRTMRELRRQSGRNETGGVLIGTFDLVRNVLHVVHAQFKEHWQSYMPPTPVKAKV